MPSPFQPGLALTSGKGDNGNARFGGRWTGETGGSHELKGQRSEGVLRLAAGPRSPGSQGAGDGLRVHPAFLLPVSSLAVPGTSAVRGQGMSPSQQRRAPQAAGPRP